MGSRPSANPSPCRYVSLIRRCCGEVRKTNLSDLPRCLILVDCLQGKLVVNRSADETTCDVSKERTMGNANGTSPLDNMRNLEHYLSDIMRGTTDTPDHHLKGMYLEIADSSYKQCFKVTFSTNFYLDNSQIIRQYGEGHSRNLHYLVASYILAAGPKFGPPKDHSQLVIMIGDRTHAHNPPCLAASKQKIRRGLICLNSD
ncbi:hypothetical protein J6590_001627 [Homalodisca vitripennis]|nr:hypothetical protein J6590_001627 [Homalodisca vitripennis]